MNDLKLADITTKCFILALFVRDDGERFLLGTGAYEFKQSQQHFAANSMSNDVVSVQGNDGYLLAGQVRRPNPQVFDGYIGDASVIKSQIEGMRRNFFAFFQKNHFYTVIYVFPDGSAIQRRRGFIVDSPEVKELYQVFPEYHVALNFEDTNYYKYAETSDGEEAYTKSANVGLSTVATGGLVWAGIETVILTGEGTSFNLSGTIDGEVLQEVLIKGDTSQTTYTGKNLLVNASNLNFTDNGITSVSQSDGSVKISGTVGSNWDGFNISPFTANVLEAGTYTFSIDHALEIPIRISFRDSDNTTTGQIAILAGSTSATGTISSGNVRTSLWCSAATGTVLDFTIKAQLEKGSTATSFEPYVGGASPNPDYPQEVQTVTGLQTVTIRGKNLCPTTTESLYLIANTGTAGKISGNSGVSIAVEQNTDYTISVQSSQARYRVGFVDTIPQNDYDTTTAYNGANGDGTSNTLTVNSGSHKYLIVNVSDLTACMVEKGSSATEFVSYQSQEYEINLGKNLFDKEIAVDGYRLGTSGEDLAASGFSISGYMKVQPNTTYTLSRRAGGSGQYANISKYTSDGTHIERLYIAPATTSYTFTTDSNCYQVRLSDVTVNISTVQLEKGSTATSYAPYFTPIELCKIGNYQDYIYKQDGDWYLHKAVGKYTILESDIAQGADYTNVYFASFPKQTDDLAYGAYPNAPTMVMDIAVFQAYSSSWNRDIYVGKFVASATGNRYWVGFTAGTTLASAKEKMTGGVIYYALATPTDTQITDENLISQLEALANATTYDRLTMFSVTSENLPATLAASVEATTQGGVEWDEYGAVFEEGSTGGATTIAVDSITEVLPVWTVKGPANNPTIQNLTTGTSMSFSGNVTASQTLKVDMLNQTATLNGTSVIGRMSGDWIELAPGNNRMYYSTGNSDAPDSSLEWQEVVG